MRPNPKQLLDTLTRSWSWVPPRPWVPALWTLGLGLGALGALVARDLPPTTAALFWAAVLGAAALLAWRGEPELWTAAPLAPPSPTVPEADRVPELPPEPPTPPLLDLVEIRGGEFLMGSPPARSEEIEEYAAEWADLFGQNVEEAREQAKDWRQREEPAHRVRVSPFALARTPLTRGQWRAVMPQAPKEWAQDGSDDRLPATHLDWAQALACCNALSEREGLTPCYRQGAEGAWAWDLGADGYRLPTEAEWELACRAGTRTRWFWGDQAAGAEAHAWYRANSEGKLHPVGEKAANPWKLHDMAGLVWEWCWDWYGDYPPDADPPPLDPLGPAEASSRVVRGGSFVGPPFFLRSALRFVVRPDARGFNLGLRCVRSRARQP